MASGQKRKQHPEGWLGVEDQLCKQVKRLHTYTPSPTDSPTVSAATVLDAGTADVAAPAVPLNSTARALGQQVTESTYPQELPALPQQGFQQLLPSPSMMPHSQQHPSSLQATQHDALPQPSVTASLQSGTLSDQPPLVVFARKVARPVLPANIPAVRLTHGLAGSSRSSLEDLPASLRRLRIPEEDSGIETLNAPRTPNQDDAEGQAAQLLTRQSSPSAESAYDAIYREANLLLKSLHFQRVQRHPGDGLPPHD